MEEKGLPDFSFVFDEDPKSQRSLAQKEKEKTEDKLFLSIEDRRGMNLTVLTILSRIVDSCLKEGEGSKAEDTRPGLGGEAVSVAEDRLKETEEEQLGVS